MKIKYCSGLFILSLILLTSCKKYINLAPIDSTYDQVFWTSGNDAENALSGAYGLLRIAFRADNSFFIFGDLPTGSFNLPDPPYWNYQTLYPTGSSKNGIMLNYNYVPYLEGSLKDWTRFYQVINQCHLIVDNATAIPETNYTNGKNEKSEVLGEAHFLRAYTYFYITKVWGDPILTTSSIKDPRDVVPLPRTAEDTVLNYCLQDLKIAASLLPFYKGTDNDKVHADKGATWSLLAQVYAWQHDYKNANIYCDSIINSGQYALESITNYKNIWLGKSDESIFEINMKYDAQNNEATAGFFGQFLRDPFIKGVSGSWEINTDNSDYLFPDTSVDKRFSLITAAVTDVRILTKYANVDYYDPNDNNLLVVNNNLVIERLADIYLLKAEAENALGNSGEAVNALNVIKQRAGLSNYSGPTDQASLLFEIVDERYRELFGEGYLAFDLIRTKTLQDYLPDAYNEDRINKKGYYWPLDMRSLLPQDNLLTQNAYWINH